MPRPWTDETEAELCAFLRAWDPIGVFTIDVEVAWPENEYDSYARSIFGALSAGAGTDGVVAALGDALHAMDLGPPGEREHELAGRIVSWWTGRG